MWISYGLLLFVDARDFLNNLLHTRPSTADVYTNIIVQGMRLYNNKHNVYIRIRYITLCKTCAPFKLGYGTNISFVWTCGRQWTTVVATADLNTAKAFAVDRLRLRPFDLWPTHVYTHRHTHTKRYTKGKNNRNGKFLLTVGTTPVFGSRTSVLIRTAPKHIVCIQYVYCVMNVRTTNVTRTAFSVSR